MTRRRVPHTNQASVWTIILLGLAFIGAGCHTAGTNHVFDGETPVLYLSLREDQGIEFGDSVWEDRGGTSQVTQETDGIQKAVDGLQGNYATDAVVFTSAPAKQTYWIDLTQPIAGTIFTGFETEDTDLGNYEVTWYVDGELGGGLRFDHTADTTGSTWNPIHVGFPPEVRVIPQGAIIEVHVTQRTGLGTFHIGTGGDAHSHLAIAYTSYDPLAGALFLENGMLLKNPSTQEEPTGNGTNQTVPAMPKAPETGPTDGISLVALGSIAIVPAIGLLGLGGRRRGRAWVALLVVAVALSGCANQQDGSFDPSGLQESTMHVSHETIKNKDGMEAPVGSGTITGVVRDTTNQPIESAHVYFEDTDLVANTGPDGAFSFGPLPFGTYQLRIDARALMSLSEDVEIVAGKATRVTVWLTLPQYGQSDDEPHQHDEWGNATRMLAETVGPFSVDTEIYIVTQDTDDASYCFGHSAAASGENGQRKDTTCVWPIPASDRTLIVPGTATVEVTLDWDNSAEDAPQELGLQFQNHGSRAAYLNDMVPRAPGDPFRIQIFPQWADPAHSQASSWGFHVTGPRTDLLTPWMQPMHEIPDITATIHLEKGIIPFEQAHE